MHVKNYNITSFRNLEAMGMICGVNPVNAFSDRLILLVNCGFSRIYFGHDLFLAARDGLDLKFIKAAVADSGLDIFSAHFGYLYPGPGDVIECIKDIHRKDLDTAAEIGLKCVTTHYTSITRLDAPGFISPNTLELYRRNTIKNGGLFFSEAINKLGGLDTFRKKNNELYRWFCDEAALRGITVTLETATCHLSRTPDQVIGLIKDIGSSNLGICLDSGHTHINGIDVAEAVRKCGSWLVETHFHDNFGDADLHRPIGIGTIDWASVILALKEIDFKGPITFEADGAPHNSEKEEFLLYARNWREFLFTTALSEARDKSLM